MSTLILQAADGTQLDLDGLVSEGRTNETTVTTAPVEEGFDVADGIVNKPKTIKFETIVYDFKHSKDTSGYKGRAMDLLGTLQDLQATATKIDILTDGPIYRQYVLTSVGYTRTTKSTRIKIQVGAQEIKTVTTKWVAGSRQNIRKTVPSAKPKTTASDQPRKVTSVERGQIDGYRLVR